MGLMRFEGQKIVGVGEVGWANEAGGRGERGGFEIREWGLEWGSDKGEGVDWGKSLECERGDGCELTECVRNGPSEIELKELNKKLTLVLSFNNKRVSRYVELGWATWETDELVNWGEGTNDWIKYWEKRNTLTETFIGNNVEKHFWIWRYEKRH